MIVDPHAAVTEPDDYDDDEDEGVPALHVIPMFGRNHESSWDCWCGPEAEWDGGVPLWVHKVHH